MSVYDLVALEGFHIQTGSGKLIKKNHEVILDAIEKTGMSALS